MYEVTDEWGMTINDTDSNSKNCKLLPMEQL